jgi:hypothetical protein
VTVVDQHEAQRPVAVVDSQGQGRVRQEALDLTADRGAILGRQEVVGRVDGGGPDRDDARRRRRGERGGA